MINQRKILNLLNPLKLSFSSALGFILGVIFLLELYWIFSQNVRFLNTILTFEEISRNAHIRLDQSDPELLNYIQNHHLTKPSDGHYNLSVVNTYASSTWIDSVSMNVINLLNHKRNGFFIECGANDGEFLSNTLRMELKYGWTGLLVEADPDPVRILKTRNRRAWIADNCLATEAYPHKVEMLRHRNLSGLSYIKKYLNDRSNNTFNSTFIAKCFPLYSILLAIGVEVVDYFSLDVEGAELAVLRTFPFNGKILIKVISVEVQIGKAEELKAFLHSKNYHIANYIEGPYVHDFIFVHNSINHLKL